MQRGMFPFECFLVRLNEQKKNITLSFPELNLRRKLIVIDVKFDNWGISLR